MSAITEQATRIGEFHRSKRRLLKKGKSETEAILEAGFESREVIIDFGRMGAQIEALNQMSAFFNPSIQGAEKLARMLNPKNPKLMAETTAKIMASITIPTMVLHWYNRNDPDYRRIPQWQRDLFWIFKVGDTYLRMPKPFEVGIIFGTGVERLMDSILEDHPDAFDDMISTFWAASTPTFIPTFAIPFVETFANRSLFLDRPIIPRDREALLPELQYNNYTLELTKWFSGLFSPAPGVNQRGAVPHILSELGPIRRSVASPAIVENWLRVWGGGLGQHFLKGTDYLLRKMGRLPDPPRPADTLADLPFVKAFVVRYPNAGAEPIQDFYEEFARAEEIRKSMRFMIRQERDPVRALELRERFRALPPLQSFRNTLAGTARAVRMVYQIPDEVKSPEQKRQMIDDMYALMILTAEQGLEVVRRHNEILKRYEQ
jgi:hypothetical protein